MKCFHRTMPCYSTNSRDLMAVIWSTGKWPIHTILKYGYRRVHLNIILIIQFTQKMTSFDNHFQSQNHHHHQNNQLFLIIFVWCAMSWCAAHDLGLAHWKISLCSINNSKSSLIHKEKPVGINRHAPQIMVNLKVSDNMHEEWKIC